MQTARAGEAQPPDAMDLRHEACLERIAEDSELAYEEAMIWQSQGGGRRARHCVAMTLFALGHEGEAASRLEKLAVSPDGGNMKLRIGYYAEAADMWLTAQEPRKAYGAATKGLEIARADIELRIVRARAYSALGRWDYAETDLTSVLAFSPHQPRALRYRADTRLRQGKLALAKADIDKSVAINESDIDSLLVRGKIIEAIRLKALKP